MLNLLRRISCFMSSPEKPYVVDNSALTGREAASVSRIPHSWASCLGAPRSPHLGAQSGFWPHCNEVIVPPQLVHPVLPQTWGKGSGAHLVGSCAGLWLQAASAVQVAGR